MAGDVERRSARTGAVTVCALLLAGGFSYRALAGYIGAELAAPVRLDPPLRSLPLVIGDWHGEELPLAETTLRIAGNDDYVNRVYRNATTGETLSLYIAYTARPRTMLRHRPSVCYPSAGWTPTGVEDTSLTLADGSVLPVRIHQFYKAGWHEQRVAVLNWYMLNGAPTLDENSFRSLFWRTPNLARDAMRYVAQVQVSAARQARCESIGTMRQFAAEVAPAAARLLPPGVKHN